MLNWGEKLFIKYYFVSIEIMYFSNNNYKYIYTFIIYLLEITFRSLKDQRRVNVIMIIINGIYLSISRDYIIDKIYVTIVAMLYFYLFYFILLEIGPWLKYR